MASLRKKRGIKDYSIPTQAQQRTQWNCDLSERAINCLFPEITTATGEIVKDYTSCTKRPNYTPESLARRAEDYFRDIYEKNSNGIPIIPDIEDFCIYANMSRQYFCELSNSTELKMNELCARINSAIALCKKQLAFDGHIHPTVFAIDFNNNHGYIQQKQQIDIRSTNMNIECRDSINDIMDRLPYDEDWKI